MTMWASSRQIQTTAIAGVGTFVLTNVLTSAAMSQQSFYQTKATKLQTGHDAKTLTPPNSKIRV